MDLLFFGSLYLNEVKDYEIEHCLLAKPGVKLEDIKKIIFHPQAIMQCSDFIDENNFYITEEVNTEVAAKKLDDVYIAVIASKELAKILWLNEHFVSDHFYLL